MPATDRASALIRSMAAAVLLTVLAAAAAAEPIKPERLAGGEGWGGLQFLGADTEGRVFVLRTETLDVHPLGPKGIGDPMALEPGSGFAPAGAITSAAMGSSSGDWLIRSGAYRLQLFRGREEEAIPDAPWLVQSVVVSGSSPIAAVAPMRGPGAPADEEAPLLVALAGRAWRPLLDGDALGDPRLTAADSAAREAAYREARWRSTVALAPGDQGRTWIADAYAFRVRELTAAGRVRSTVTLGAEPKMEIVERPAEEQEQIRAAAAAAGRRLPAALPGLASKPSERILGLTEGRDGKLYLLTHTRGRLDLARWDSLARVLERTQLEKTDLGIGKLSLAAGRHALYIATVGASDGGRWSIPWEVIESARWEPFEEAVHVDGAPLPAAAHPTG